MSDNNEEWIYGIIPAEQVEEIENKAERLEYNLDNGINIVLIANNDSAIKLCRAFDASKKGDMTSWAYIKGFMSSLIETIEAHLRDEGIDPYGK